MKIARESWVIAAIGIADLITTIIFIRHHGAQEANPLFRLYWEMGLFAFIAAKMACLLGPIVVLEWARKRNPLFVSRALRGAIAAYLIFYGVGFVRLNAPMAYADELRPNTPMAFHHIPASYLEHRSFEAPRTASYGLTQAIAANRAHLNPMPIGFLAYDPAMGPGYLPMMYSMEYAGADRLPGRYHHYLDK